jgi:hypothetical protein
MALRRTNRVGAANGKSRVLKLRTNVHVVCNDHVRTFPNKLADRIERIRTVETMVLGITLMLIGSLLVLRNRSIARLLGREPRINQWGFMTSLVRQNIALIGTVFFVGGFVFFVIF